jgi:hypothetical protein
VTFLRPPKPAAPKASPVAGRICVLPEAEPFRYGLRAPYSEALTTLLSPKQLGPPGLGFRKDEAKGARWTFDPGLLPYVTRACLQTLGEEPTVDLKMDGAERGRLLGDLHARGLTTGMYPFQEECLSLTLKHRGGGYFLEQGLGKTWPAVVSHVALGSKRTLVIVPPRVAFDFKVEIRKRLGKAVKLWPEKAYSASDCPPDTAEFCIISKHRLHYILKSAAFTEWVRGVQLVLIDECQGFKNYTAACTGYLKEILKLCPWSVRTPMSGTPLPDRVGDLYQPMDLCYPWLFSSRDKFNIRYLRPERNSGGFVAYKELNGRHDEELRERVAGISVRATKEANAHLLPPFSLSRLEVEAKLPKGYVSPADPTRDQAEAEMQLLAKPKALAAISRTLEVYEDETPYKWVVLTYHRDVAEMVYEGLSALDADGVDRVLIWGGLSDAEFNARVARAADPARNTVLVANMSAIETGLNRLVCFNRGLMAELYYRPATVSQALARFHRGGSQHPVSFEVLFCPGTLDDRIYSSLATKIDDISKVLLVGSAETEIQALDDSEDWQEALRAAAEEM